MDCLLQTPVSLAWSLLAQATTTTPAGNDGGISSGQWLAIGALVAVIVVPIILGGIVARAIRMPDYSTRIAWVLFALIASATILTFGKLGLGVDLRGGTILVYEIDPNRGIPANAGETTVDSETGIPKGKIASSDLVPSLIRRINPAGTQEIAIRPYGEDQIEIIIPAVDQRDVDRIKNIISQAGILRFAILANTRDHGRLIELARTQAEDASQRLRMSKTVYDIDEKTPAGFWAIVDREEKENADGIKPLRVDVSRSIVRNPVDGRLIELPPNVFGTDGVANWMKSEGLENIQVLMSVDPELDVTGEDLAFASTSFDNDGSPCVRFKLTDAGSGRFLALTTNNAPDGQHLRFLGIVLDDKLLSAPSIRSPIQGDGQITGNFTTEEVEQLVRILKAGQLPAALTKQPIAENQIDATLGADTIRSGLLATVGSLIVVLLFMLFYYRFLGIIACLALTLNLLMTLAVMILINQPLTLPGIAGLVLTIGMAVDANVLIFERMREEIAKGAAPRMAIRNGFARATTTIIDSNLTTLITAIVLYAIGTDQIRGFAVTLILGLIFSMFTAIYMSRTLLDIAERRGFLSLSMSDMISKMRDSITGPKGIDLWD
jgi:SecD/SecF fusion protein